MGHCLSHNPEPSPEVPPVAYIIPRCYPGSEGDDLIELDRAVLDAQAGNRFLCNPHLCRGGQAVAAVAGLNRSRVCSRLGIDMRHCLSHSTAPIPEVPPVAYIIPRCYPGGEGDDLIELDRAVLDAQACYRFLCNPHLCRGGQAVAAVAGLNRGRVCSPLGIDMGHCLSHSTAPIPEVPPVAYIRPRCYPGTEGDDLIELDRAVLDAQARNRFLCNPHLCRGGQAVSAVAGLNRGRVCSPLGIDMRHCLSHNPEPSPEVPPVAYIIPRCYPGSEGDDLIELDRAVLDAQACYRFLCNPHLCRGGHPVAAVAGQDAGGVCSRLGIDMRHCLSHNPDPTPEVPSVAHIIPRCYPGGEGDDLIELDRAVLDAQAGNRFLCNPHLCRGGHPVAAVAGLNRSRVCSPLGIDMGHCLSHSTAPIPEVPPVAYIRPRCDVGSEGDDLIELDRAVLDAQARYRFLCNPHLCRGGQAVSAVAGLNRSRVCSPLGIDMGHCLSHSTAPIPEVPPVAYIIPRCYPGGEGDDFIELDRAVLDAQACYRFLCNPHLCRGGQGIAAVAGLNRGRVCSPLGIDMGHCLSHSTAPIPEVPPVAYIIPRCYPG